MTAAGGLISVLVGTVLLRLTLTGTYGRYVRLGMGPWLAVAGVVAIVLGLVTLVHALRHTHPADAHDHRRGGGDRVGWLLLAPVAALLLVAPPTLGSYGVGRGAEVDIRSGGGVLDPLVPGAEPVPMTLLEFGQRAFDRGGASFNGAAVQLTGFVAGAEEDGFRLARYQIACCAADAAPVVLRVVGVHGGPARDQWVTVTGVFQPGGDEVPELAATSVVEIPAPDDPYE
ncbi:MAG TPA: TIGR03943 family protein [Actinomycetes bacterium]|nr:TIGR03943 family protein [Actinomycetes bacterium]